MPLSEEMATIILDASDEPTITWLAQTVLIHSEEGKNKSFFRFYTSLQTLFIHIFHDLQLKKTNISYHGKEKVENPYHSSR